MAGRGVRLDFGAEGVAVHFGHHDVGDDQVGDGLERFLHALQAVAALHDVVVVGQFGAEEAANLVVVLDDDDGAAALALLQFGLLVGQALGLAGDLGRGRCLLFVLVGEYLVGLQVAVAQRDGDDELASVAVVDVMGLDGAVVHLHQRAGEVEANACAHIAVGGRGGQLIEAVEDAFHLVGGNLLTIVVDRQDGLTVVVGDVDADDAARLGELEGIRQDVDHHLVEVAAVEPDGQLVGVVFVGELYVLGLGLLGKERVDVVDKPDEVGFAHVQLHLSLIDLAQVHHLVDESENTLGIAAHGLVEAMALRVVVLFDERLQRCDDERHRRAYLVADVHEEAQLGVGHLLGMDMLLQAQLVLQLALAVTDEQPDGQCRQQQVGQQGPCGGIPRGMHLDGELADVGLLLVVGGLHAEVVGARRHAAEGDFVDTGLQTGPFLAVDAIEIGDVLGIVVGEGGQLEGERIVVVAQVEAVGLDDQAVGDGIDARLHAGGDGSAAHDKAGEVDIGFPCLGHHIGGVEPADASGTAEEQGAPGVGADGAVAELAALQSVVDIVVGERLLLGVEAAQSVVGAYPQVALAVAGDRGYAVGRQSVLSGVVAVFAGVQVVAVETVVGACPHTVARVGIYGAHERVVVGTIGAEGVGPAVGGDIVARQSHRAGHKEAPLVAGEEYLAQVVVGQTVDLVVVVGTLLHAEGRHLSRQHVEAHQSVAHGGYPHIAVGGRGQSEHVDVAAHLEVYGMPLARQRVHPSAALSVGTQPDAALGVFGHGKDGARALGEMACRGKAAVHQVEAVFVGAYPCTAVAVDEGARHTVGADDVVVAQAVAHIAEVHFCLGLHEESFLQQTNPDVAVAVFEDGHRLALGHVHLTAVEGIAGQQVVLRIVDGDTLSVATHQQTAVAGGAERVDGQSCRLLDECELPFLLVEAVDSLAGGSHIDVALRVLTDFAEHRPVAGILEEGGAALALDEHEAVVLGDHPETSHGVFHGKADVALVAAQLLVGLSGSRLLVQPQDAIARRAGQDVALAGLHEVVYVGADGVSAAVFHLEIVEAGTVVCLHGVVAANIEGALAALRHAVDIVAAEPRPLVFLLEDAELIAVVAVQSVTGGHPDKAVVVLEHL